MKEKLIKEISNAMTEVLSMAQIVQLNSTLLQIVSKYTKLQKTAKSCMRILQQMNACLKSFCPQNR